jgi:hypothetical protein
MIIVYVLIFIALFLMWGALMNHSDSKKKRKEIERKVKDEKIRIDSLTPREKEAELKINLERGKDRCFRQRVLKLKEIIESTEGVRQRSSEWEVTRLSERQLNDFIKHTNMDKETADDVFLRNLHCDNSLSYKQLEKIKKNINDGINNLINKEFREVIENRRDVLDGNIKDINILREKFLKYSDVPKGKRQQYYYDTLVDSFNSIVTQTVKTKLSKKLLYYFKQRAVDYHVGIIYFDYKSNDLKENGDKERLNLFKADLLKNDNIIRRLYFAKIKSNIDDKSYLQIGTTFEENLSLISNDVVDVVDIYKDIELESNIALALQYQLLRKYRPNNYIAEDEFSEFERFDGYTEIVPMKYKTQVCKDIDNVVDNYKDVKFVFKNLVLLNDLNS